MITYNKITCKTLLLAFFFISITFASCKRDLLDLKPLDSVSDADVWNDPNLVQAFINRRYDQIGWGWTESWMSSVVDETYLIWSRGCEPITRGFVNPNDLGRMNGGWYGGDNRNWKTIWDNIKDCNVFFQNIDQVPFTDEELKNRFLGEITFIRALMYFDLVSKYGGVPLVTVAYDLDNMEEGAQLPRNDYETCVAFIVNECDKAASLLPATFSGSDNGRATSVAALALKSRMLLYAASPLMNEQVQDELVGYTTPSVDRWIRAADAAKAVIDLASANGYGLYDQYGDDVKTNYTEMFLDKSSREVLFSRQNYGSPNNMHYIDQVNYPNGYGGWGGNVPIQEFVDDFEVLQEGQALPFNWNNPTLRSTPYANRDPRLYAYVLYDGASWKDRTLETHFREQSGTNALAGGRDTRDGTEPWNTSTSGYNMRKFINEGYVANSWNFVGRSAQNWIWFRLAEAYLNYAEAQYHAGNEGDARWGVNMIRNRARMPEITASGTELLEKIRHERRIELAFEEHRYFDIRRWMIAEDVMNRNATGVVIIKKLDGTTEYRAHTGTPETVVEERSFVAPRMYWLPIPQYERDRNPNLQQNPGY
ncbi:RagB/SusD family nutrient uptake outer membrane protein [Olivibacter sp. SDN3]|uniref:RagB/SusD family nutrient uptake outer membrane protein n=1 Tax=Olivibacter sp. SDN3 TaxID=2764720 RepID=UPI001650F461|nr:RagB/SusD family nutrient uptake outer membrane protein [Olivibacter sp. SDN3]QNL51656.1 RagB/SusD family nutrient uptake outer membrane protein [Olivibacter sp. SDN3]